MTLRSIDLQSDSDLDSIGNTCDVFSNMDKRRLLTIKKGKISQDLAFKGFLLEHNI